ncbi:MAG: DUF6605 domain-containing protein [Kineosporiaceae bacterium]
MPSDLLALPTVSPVCRAAAERALTPAGMRAENALPGDASWRPDVNTAAHWPVQLYLDAASTTCGTSVGVHLGGRGGGVRLLAYRVGWYGGAGARLVWQSGPISATGEPVRLRPGIERTVALNWPVRAQLPVTPSWTPGVYLIAAVPPGSTSGAVAPLVVRSDGTHAPLLFMAADTTWQAYNPMGGASQYGGRGTTHAQEYADRAYTVSEERPLIGTGLQQLASMDLPLVRFLAQHGLATDYTTATAVDANPSTLLHHHGIVVPGHSEYWTARMYDGVEAARNAGVNIAFLGANEVYWHLRITRDAAGRALSQVVYRQATIDPLAPAQPFQATVRWADAPLRRDESQLVGARFSGVSVFGPARVMDAASWVVHGTGLTDGAVIPRWVGNEVDAVRPGTTAPAGPPGVDVVLEGAFTGRGENESPTFTTSYYSTPSGAGVFAAGTTYWACHVDDSCPLQTVGPRTQRLVDTVTLTVLQAFAQQRAGLTHPAVPHPAVSAAAVRALFGTAPIAGRHPPGA